MILTFIFTFLKKIKKGEAYITFILYILIFCFFCVEKNPVFTRECRFLSLQKAMYITTKSDVYHYKKRCISLQNIVYVVIKWYNESIENTDRKISFSMPI